MIQPALLRQRLKEITLLRGDSCSVVYDRKTLSVRPVGLEYGNLLSSVLDGIETLPDDSVAWEIVQTFLAHHCEAVKEANPIRGISKCLRPQDEVVDIAPNVPPNRYLSKLAINIANDCNLACDYCYANKGFYGNPESILATEQTVEDIVLKFSERFEFIGSVQFMGGEPSLNPAAIRRTYHVFRRLVEDGVFRAMPTFTMVSNGLKFSSQFISVVQECGAHITISLDGPKEVHDSIRKSRNGSGSYELIRKNIELAREHNIGIEFEPTFSQRHIAMGMHLIDLCQWFFDEFGVKILHAPPVSENRYYTDKDGLGLSEEEKVREFCAVTEWGLDNLLNRNKVLMHSFTARLLANFDQRIKNTHYCPAGNSLLSASVKGEIFPCWMYTDEKQFSLGTIKDADFLGKASETVLSAIEANELAMHPECQACFIQPVCFGCKGGDYHATGSISAKPNCSYLRAMVATLIVGLFDRTFREDHKEKYYGRPALGERLLAGLAPSVQSTPHHYSLIQIDGHLPHK